MDFYLQNQSEVEIVSGGARGADSLGEQYARERGFKLSVFRAEWNKYGKSAGYRRNEQMALYADAVVVFWDGVSKGSKHMIDIAMRQGIKVRVVRF